MTELERERWGRLLEEALGRPSDERAGFLEEACEGDTALRAEIASLLAAFEASSGTIESFAENVVSRAVGDVMDVGTDVTVVGERVSHYEILERVGDGGMGVVYRARDVRLDRSVALKFLAPRLGMDAEARARLRAEARAASALDHPNVGVLHEIGETESGGLFLVMAWYDGETLHERIRRGPLSVPEALTLARQLAGALVSAHVAGIVHRDVKPSNLVITSDGVAKLVDFGIARGEDAPLTREGTTPGTVAYMSPERTRGGGTGPAIDLWSFGVVLYEMLTGRRPFRGDDDAAVIHQIRHDEPARIRRVRPDVPRAVEKVVATCLAKDPSRRYVRAEELLAALDEAGAHPGSVRGPGPRPPWAPPRVRAAALLGAAALLAIPGAILLTGRSSGPELDPERLIVARFENRTGDEALEPLGSVAADWIAQGLSRTGLVQVVPTTAALTASRYAGSVPVGDGADPRPRVLAEESGAGIVVSGAYSRQGDSLYMWASATDAILDRVLHAVGPFATPVDQPLAGVEHLRGILMSELAAHLDSRVPEHVLRAVDRPPPYEAYRAFAEGIEAFVVRDWRGALSRFADAVEHGPGFTAPLVFSGMALVNLGDLAAVDSILVLASPQRHRMSEVDRRAFEYLAAWTAGDLSAAHRAHLRNPEIAPGGFAHWGLANTALNVNRPREAVRVSRDLDPDRGELRGWYFYWRDLARAHHLLGEHRTELRVARRARERFPDDPQAIVQEVRALAALLRVRALRSLLADEGLRHPNRAWLLQQAGLELVAHGRRAAGEALFAESLALQLFDGSTLPGARMLLAESLVETGAPDDAEAVLSELAQERPDLWQVEAALGVLAARRGDAAEAARASARLAALEVPYLRGANTFWRARIAAGSGNADEAVRLLRQAFGEGWSAWDQLHREPDFAPVRGHAAFEEFLRPKG